MVVIPPHNQSGRTNELVKLRTMETSQLESVCFLLCL